MRAAPFSGRMRMDVGRAGRSIAALGSRATKGSRICCLGRRNGRGPGGRAMASSEHSASREEMMAARLPLGARDACAKLLIPLNQCRVESFYLPWKCEDERHAYERCEYHLFLLRMKKMQEIRESQLQPATS